MRNRGFTYVELGLVVAILFVFASLMLPNFVRLAKSRDLRLFKTRLAALAKEARTRAVQSGDTVALSYDKDSTKLQAIEENVDHGTFTLDELAMPDGVAATQFSANREESPSDGWRLPFYADGASAGGGIQFEADDQPFYLYVAKGDARPKVQDGPLPDTAFDQWPAGGYAPRS